MEVIREREEKKKREKRERKKFLFSLSLSSINMNKRKFRWYLVCKEMNVNLLKDRLIVYTHFVLDMKLTNTVWTYHWLKVVRQFICWTMQNKIQRQNKDETGKFFLFMGNLVEMLDLYLNEYVDREWWIRIVCKLMVQNVRHYFWKWKRRWRIKQRKLLK